MALGYIEHALIEVPIFDTVGDMLDAKVEIDGTDIILHSRSGAGERARNPDYRRALEAILARLAAEEIKPEVFLDSAPARQKRPLESDRCLARGRDLTGDTGEQADFLIRRSNAGSESHGAWRRLRLRPPQMPAYAMASILDGTVEKRREGLAAAQLKLVERRHVEAAVAELRGDAERYTRFGAPTGYWLLTDEGKLALPPKKVFGIALAEALQTYVGPNDFSSGDTIFRILAGHGFDVVPMPEAVGGKQFGDPRHPHGVQLSPTAFRDAFGRFQRKVAAADHGHAFTNFNEGLAAVWEAYKPRLRAHAVALLAADNWSESQIGSGTILKRVIAAIEIQDRRVNLTNNLLFWQNRFGHAQREHRALLEAETNAGLRRDLEGLFYQLYRGTADEGVVFDQLSEATGGRYTLLGYLYFLKDPDRFMPIQPTTFDRAFHTLALDLVTLRHCTWANYVRYNASLEAVRSALTSIEGLSKSRLVDAHSFCFMLEKLPEPATEGKAPGRKDAGRIVGGRERCIIAMRVAIESTVKQGNGQAVERIVKIKETDLSSAEIDRLLTELMDLQGNRCALTGIPFDFAKDGDKSLFPSADRIDSKGQYTRGNIQVVCRFINFWKGSAENEDFTRLLSLVRKGGGNPGATTLNPDWSPSGVAMPG
nr:hypothetical protein [Brevundimonas diminuta]